jgi:hypothetical protein
MKQRQTSDGRTKCGFCATGHHENCRPEIKWYDKVWYCYCEICKNVVVSESENLEQKEESNE